MGRPQTTPKPKKRKSRLKHGIEPLNPNGHKNSDVVSCELRVILNKDGTPNKLGKKAYHAETVHGELIQLRRVSSILDTLGKSEGLMIWAARMTAKYVDEAWDVTRKRRYTPGEKEYILRNAAEYHNTYKEETAELGTEAHKWIERFFKHGEWPGPDDLLDPRVANSLELFALKWRELGYQVMESEFYVYDVELDYGGTADIICWDPATKTWILIDLKTGNGCYSNHLYQVSAYWGALHKMGDKGYPISKVMIMRIGRTDALTQIVEPEPEEIEEGYEIFKILCQIQRSTSKLDGRYQRRKQKWLEEMQGLAKQNAELEANLVRMVRESEVA